MPLSLDALITRTKAQMAAEKDPEKLAALAASLHAYKKTKTHIEKHETEEGDKDDEDDDEDSAKGDETDRKADDPDDEGNDDDDSDDDSDVDDKDGKKSKKKPASDSDSDSDEDDDSDDDSEEDEEDEEDEASADESEEEAAAAVADSIVRASGLTEKSTRRNLHKVARGMIVKTLRASAAYKVYNAAVKITKKHNAMAIIGALEGHAEGAKELRTRVAAIEAERRQERKTSAISAALASRRITRAEAKTLRGKKLSFVESYIDMRPTPLVRSSEDAHVPPPAATPHGASSRVALDPKTGIPTDPAVAREVRKALAGAKANGIGNLERFEKDLLQSLAGAGAKVKLPEV